MLAIEFMFKDNYKYLLRRSGKNYSDVARYVKCSPQNARDWAKKDQLPRPKSMERIADFFGVPVEKLQYGTLDDSVDVRVRIGKNLPLLKLSEVDKYLSFKHAYERGFHSSFDVSDEAFVVIQEGDSMEDRVASVSIQDGARVIIEPSSTAKQRSIVLAKIKDTGAFTIKKLLSDAGNYFLVPINKMYHPIPVDENVEIIGIAKYSIDEQSLVSE